MGRGEVEPPTSGLSLDEIRRLRDYTRLRTDLVRERSRHVQRLEKLLEDALIKPSSVATDIMGVIRPGADRRRARPVRPRGARQRAAPQEARAALVEALTGRFDDHHAELARMLLDEIDGLSAKIDTLTLRIDGLIAEIPANGYRTSRAPSAKQLQQPRRPTPFSPHNQPLPDPIHFRFSSPRRRCRRPVAGENSTPQRVGLATRP